MEFLDVIDLLEAKPEEPSQTLPDCHYQQVGAAHCKFDVDVTAMMDDKTTFASDNDKTTDAAHNLLRKIWRESANTKIRENCDILTKYVELGTYSKLTRELARIYKQYRQSKLTTIDFEMAIKGFVPRYHKSKNSNRLREEQEGIPQIILSETFI